ncbi:MAG: dockerin type I repeat-containing protein, partial [Dehalococcoidia bacterium]|nr:dockerin type I repeat-containing protein [Dehalococcoidia bacterium]
TPTITPEQPMGSVNCDSVVNSIDASLILQEVAAIIDSVPCPENGDVNNDGMRNAVDSALILQYEAGMIDGYTRTDAGAGDYVGAALLPLLLSGLVWASQRPR